MVDLRLNERNTDPDRNIIFYSWQGVAGEVLKTGEFLREDFDSDNTLSEMSFRERWLFKNKYALSYRQLKKTSAIRMTIASPIIEQDEADPSSFDEVVGVVLIDCLSDAAAKRIRDKSEQEIKDMAESLLKAGTLLLPYLK